jgi:hypothetical protein
MRRVAERKADERKGGDDIELKKASCADTPAWSELLQKGRRQKAWAAAGVL